MQSGPHLQSDPQLHESLHTGHPIVVTVVRDFHGIQLNNISLAEYLFNSMIFSQILLLSIFRETANVHVLFVIRRDGVMLLQYHHQTVM